MTVNLFQYYQDVLDNEFDTHYSQYLSYDIYKETYLEPAVDSLINNYSVAGLKTPNALDFNDLKLRCAYLYMYATSHSHMVIEALTRLNNEAPSELANLIVSGRIKGALNITSLGGGPGSDPMGILTFLDMHGYWPSYPNINVHLVDNYKGWEQTFQSVMLKYKVNASFTAQDLLKTASPKVKSVIMESHLISMVKFISAISGNRNESSTTLKTVFQLLRPGTLVLIIDNAGGGDFQRALNIAYMENLNPVFEPLCHFNFKIPPGLEKMGQMRFGNKRAQTGSKISMVVLRKSASMMDTIRGNVDYLGFNSFAGTPVISNYKSQPAPPILQQTNRVQPITRRPMVNWQPSSNQARNALPSTPPLSQQQRSANPILSSSQLSQATVFPARSIDYTAYPRETGNFGRQYQVSQQAQLSSGSSQRRIHPQVASASSRGSPQELQRRREPTCCFL